MISRLFLRVEVAGRLVGQQDRGVVDQRARDRDALLLAARELARVVVPRGRRARARAAPRRARSALSCGRRPRRSSGSTTFSSALVRASSLKLWNTKPIRRLRIWASAGSSFARDVDAFEEIGAARRAVEAAEDVHQRGLARARRAHDREELAALDRQVTPRSARTSSRPCDRSSRDSRTSMTARSSARLRTRRASAAARLPTRRVRRRGRRSRRRPRRARRS